MVQLRKDIRDLKGWITYQASSSPMRSKKWKINTEKTEQENKGSEFNVG